MEQITFDERMAVLGQSTSWATMFHTAATCPEMWPDRPVHAVTRHTLRADQVCMLCAQDLIATGDSDVLMRARVLHGRLGTLKRAAHRDGLALTLVSAVAVQASLHTCMSVFPHFAEQIALLRDDADALVSLCREGLLAARRTPPD